MITTHLKLLTLNWNSKISEKNTRTVSTKQSHLHTKEENPIITTNYISFQTSNFTLNCRIISTKNMSRHIIVSTIVTDCLRGADGWSAPFPNIHGPSDQQEIVVKVFYFFTFFLFLNDSIWNFTKIFNFVIDIVILLSGIMAS